MSRVTVEIEYFDALAAGQTMRTLAALDRCGSRETAAMFRRVGDQLLAAAEVAPIVRDRKDGAR